MATPTGATTGAPIIGIQNQGFLRSSIRIKSLGSGDVLSESHWSPNVFRITSQGKAAAMSFVQKLSSGARLSSAMAMM